MNSLNPPVGSRWRKWDLHVHTPESLYNNYAGGWDAFLDDLEKLPPEFAVLGINDYLFLRGYELILEARQQGRLQNIQTVLPVIEFRLNMYGGTESALSKVNLHVIFSEELSPQLIQSQFLNGLTNQYQLNPHYKDQVTWEGVVTRDSLEDLGRQIKKTIPADKLPDYASDLMEGFRNLTLDHKQIRQVLKSSYFEDKYLITVGKTEWADIKWNDQSIADKKSIINDADAVFIAAKTPSHWASNQAVLAAANVNSRLLDCSDAHNLSSSTDKDRIGNSLTWINADPTFEGLCHAIHDYESRVFIGDRPAQFVSLEAHPGDYIEHIRIAKKSGSDLTGQWFDVDLELNPGFAAVIGNKGMGKSALVDVIGLLGSSRNDASFSFLNSRKFRHPRSNKARFVDATLTWHSGEGMKRNLDYDVDHADVERVRYLPQSMLDSLCNEDPASADSKFEDELGHVIFSHVDTADRLGCDSIDELIQVRSAPIERRLQILRDELQILNREIATAEGRLSPTNVERLKRELKLRQEDLQRLQSQRPVEVPKPPDTTDDAVSKGLLTKLEESNTQLQSLKDALQAAQADASSQALKEAAARRVLLQLANLEHEFQSFTESIALDLALLSLAPADVAVLTLHRAALEKLGQDATAAKVTAQNSMDLEKPGSLRSSQDELLAAVDRIVEQLDAPKRLYQSYLQTLQDWETRCTHLHGDEVTQGTIVFLEKSLQDTQELKPHLVELRGRRLEKLREIHAQLSELSDVYRETYAPVQKFINTHKLAAEHFDLGFDVSLVLSLADLSEPLFEQMISRSTAGSFFGIEDSAKLLEEWSNVVDPNDVDQIVDFVQHIDDALHVDQRAGKQQSETAVDAQLRSGTKPEDVYDLVFDLQYVHPRYVLQSRGKPISRLSPGEKGTLLLMFYLLVDKDTSPIIIDQPEENLDSQTVVALLVPAIKDAKTRRQVILVTHSPNLAVVGDADQVICATFEADEFKYTSGSIENPEINRHVLDILEGTSKAFRDRGEKYIGLPWRRVN